ncbi:MAG TPA: hypothetical protein VF532_09890 [Candidatus Angelobacter sp.]
MESNLDEQIEIKLSKSELLVLFEFLARSYDAWRTAGDQDVATFVLSKPDDGERTALWHLEGKIESTLVEVFADNYNELVRQAKDALTAE